jgi:hypothetical protein
MLWAPTSAFEVHDEGLLASLKLNRDHTSTFANKHGLGSVQVVATDLHVIDTQNYVAFIDGT